MEPCQTCIFIMWVLQMIISFARLAWAHAVAMLLLPTALALVGLTTSPGYWNCERATRSQITLEGPFWELLMSCVVHAVRIGALVLHWPRRIFTRSSARAFEIGFVANHGCLSAIAEQSSRPCVHSTAGRRCLKDLD